MLTCKNADKHNLLYVKPGKEPHQAARKHTEASVSTKQAVAITANYTNHNMETLISKVTLNESK